MSPSIWEKEGESGLLDNFEFTVTKSWFGTHEKYQGGQVVLLQWEGVTDSLDYPINNVWYSFGTGWISKDGGLTIEHESGNPEKFFQKNSQYNRIIRRCVDDFGLKDLMEDRGDPFHADIWVGLKFLMVAEEQQQIKNRETGQMESPRPKVMPAKFLGVVESNGTGAKAATAKATTTATTSTATGSETPKEKMERLRAEKAAVAASAGAGGELTLRDQVIEALKGHLDDFEAAQTAALAVDGVMENDDLITELMDEEGLFKTVRDEVGAAA